MKRKIALFSLFAILTFALITTNVFAIFQLNRNVDVDATFGKVISCSVALEELTNRDDLGPDVAANYKAITSDRLGYDGSSLYCYASARRSFNTEEYLELKNLKVTVTADSTIFTYIRVKIQDSWSSYRVYNSGTKKNEIIPKAKEAFIFDSEKWYFDEATGYAYYKELIKEKTAVTLFDYSDYEYKLAANGAYRETIFVTIGFQAEAVQANRIDAVWGINPSIWK